MCPNGDAFMGAGLAGLDGSAWHKLKDLGERVSLLENKVTELTDLVRDIAHDLLTNRGTIDGKDIPTVPPREEISDENQHQD